MHGLRPRFNLIFLAALLAAAGVCSPLFAASESSPAFKKGDPSLYQDMVDQSFFYEGVNLLYFDRFYRKLFGKKLRSFDINDFDEVPDSAFFVNRHAKKRLSAEDLQQGVDETGGPDLTGDLTIFYAEADENPPKFWVRDAKGNEYLLKFDPQDYLELATSAEAITNRAYHAIGYHVFESRIISFPAEKLTLAEGTDIYDSTGFKKKLTPEKLQELTLFIPADSQGSLRALAIKIPKGEVLGGWNFTTQHAKRRSVRALQVFGSWLNNDDMRQSATTRVSNGKEFTYYLTDLDSALGAGNQGPKPPMLAHEHMVDFGETAKAFLTLGLWEKPWQKRWREAGEKIHSNAVGYFDNAHFDPGKFKTQLPYYAFKDVTRADGFWAAKILMTFSDEDVRAIVKSGQYSDSADEKYVADTLIERRNRVAQYWFEKANPLDEFDVQGNNIVFKDLAAEYGFAPEGKSTYQVEVISRQGKKTKKIAAFEAHSASIPMESSWRQGDEKVGLLIRTLRPDAPKPSPYVLVELDSKGVAGVSHQD